MEEPSFRPGFNAYRTWRGAAWMNTTWLLVGGLRALGAHDEADTLAQHAADAVERSGFREYYHPRTGAGHGEHAFGFATLVRPPDRVFATRRGSAERVKLLVVTPEPIDAAALRKTLGDEVKRRRGARPLARHQPVQARLLGLRSRRRDRRGRPRPRPRPSSALEDEGVDAAGEVGESEPAQAIDDALATFAADRIVIFSHPEGDRDYREDEPR